MFSVAIATADRRGDLERTISFLRSFDDIDDINIVSDADKEVLNYDFLMRDSNISVSLNEDKQGPGRTKLLAIERCKHQIVLVIDDDADLISLPSIDEARSLLKKYPVVQGLIFKDSSGGMRSFEQPFIFGSSKRFDCEISCFVGAVHLIAKNRFIALGCYGSLSGYGYEELDACLRIFKAGSRVFLTGLLKVIHHRTIVGRPSVKLQSRALLTNRLTLNSYYPRILCMVADVVWKIRFAIKYRDLELLKIAGDEKCCNSLSLSGFDLLKNRRLVHRLLV